MTEILSSKEYKKKSKTSWRQAILILMVECIVLPILFINFNLTVWDILQMILPFMFLPGLLLIKSNYECQMGKLAKKIEGRRKRESEAARIQKAFDERGAQTEMPFEASDMRFIAMPIGKFSKTDEGQE